jgi:hypothetical protein
MVQRLALSSKIGIPILNPDGATGEDPILSLAPRARGGEGDLFEFGKSAISEQTSLIVALPAPSVAIDGRADCLIRTLDRQPRTVVGTRQTRRRQATRRYVAVS